jgi:hypothetical protein
MKFLIQLEDRRNVGENSCNSGDGTDQRVQSLMLLMMEFLIALFLHPYPDMPLSSIYLNTSSLTFCCINHKHKPYIQLQRALKVVCFSRHDLHFEILSHVSDYESDILSETGNVSVFRSNLRMEIAYGHLSTR